MSTSNTHAKLWDLIKDTRFGMLVHRHGDGLLHSHPLTTQNKELDEQARFTSSCRKNGDIGATWRRAS